MNEACERTLRNLDAWIDGELAATAAGEVADHVRGCAACSAEADSIRQLRARLREATAQDPASPFLGQRVMARIRTQPRRRRWMRWAMASLLLIASLATYRIVTQKMYVASLVQHVSASMAPALGDHVYCSVQRRYGRRPPDPETLRADIGPEYQALLAETARNVPAGFQIHIAHECSHGGRRFIHIGLHDGSRQISLVMTKRRAGESFRADGLKPVLSRAGLEVYGASAERFQIAGMETATHLAWVVSDAGQAPELLAALASEIGRTTARLKG